MFEQEDKYSSSDFHPYHHTLNKKKKKTKQIKFTICKSYNIAHTCMFNPSRDRSGAL